MFTKLKMFTKLSKHATRAETTSPREKPELRIKHVLSESILGLEIQQINRYTKWI